MSKYLVRFRYISNNEMFAPLYLIPIEQTIVNCEHEDNVKIEFYKLFDTTSKLGSFKILSIEPIKKP